MASTATACADDNQSWNCGAEGPTDDPQVLALRRRQIKNALTMLLLSRGVPMLLMGDEVGRTQQGNNNAYCHDNPLTWLDWSLQEQSAELFRFCQQLIAFRQRHSALRQTRHASSGSSDGDVLQVTWHGTRARLPHWAPHSRVLACMLCGSGAAGPDVMYAAMNIYWEPLTFEEPPPEDIWEPGQELPPPESREGRLEGRAILVLVARSAVEWPPGHLLGANGWETFSWKGREVNEIEEAAHKGEMHVSRPAVDTLFVRLSGS